MLVDVTVVLEVVVEDDDVTEVVLTVLVVDDVVPLLSMVWIEISSALIWFYTQHCDTYQLESLMAGL